MNQASIPKGTRDFSPKEMARRQYIFSTLRRHFESFGFEALETPSMENLSTLTGKYGDEGDQLIFKILNSGDFMKKVDRTWVETNDLKKISPAICEKARCYESKQHHISLSQVSNTTGLACRSSAKGTLQGVLSM
jgi:histidyl-tRNA synthetase